LISVKDTGMGISKENLEQIFNRFFRTDEARSRYKGGSGLGLSIVKEIIKSHNGTISVNSVLNQGTEFIIRIPKI
jgi:signal transduction histidine kinase